MTAELLALASQFGAPGLLITFMVWDRIEQAKREKARSNDDHLLNRERIEADLKVATSLAMLAERIGNNVR